MDWEEVSGEYQSMNIKNIGDKIDKKAMGLAITLMLMSWGALPIVYLLLKRENKRREKENVG